MILLDTVKSKIDATVKFIFQLDDGLIMEMAYIDNNTGKDIICVSAQSACSMGCKLCHTTDYIGKLKVRNITSNEFTEGINRVGNEINLWVKKRMLLISFMGCGEPTMNIKEIVDAMYRTHKYITPSRFAIATMMPKDNWLNFANLTNEIKELKLPVKLHLSLHSPFDEVRSELIPRAMAIEPSLKAFQFYRAFTGNAVEIHYAMIKGVNDSDKDMVALGDLLWKNKIPIKLMPYNEKATSTWEHSDSRRAIDFADHFDRINVQHEFYTPPGLDVGASCGQFLFDYYLKYNKL